MGAVIVSLEPSSPMMLLVFIRDEAPRRPWLPPARHWPEEPLIGGKDELAGGTWLAVHPAIPRVACVLNGRGQHAPQPFRRSRGELPLRAGAGGRPAVDGLDPAAYDPFHLIVADIASVQLLSWDGVRATRVSLSPGTHLITSTGLDLQATHVAGKFAVARPAASPAARPGEAWGAWPELAAGTGRPETTSRAIKGKHPVLSGPACAASSVSYVGFAPAGLRYDFQPASGQIRTVSTTR
jgi:hypothetical protein